MKNIVSKYYILRKYNFSLPKVIKVSISKLFYNYN